MLKSPLTRSSVCAVAMLSATGASADVTAAQIWSEWQDLLGVYGEDSLSFSGGTDQGGVVEVEDLKLTMTNEDAEITAELGTLTFEELGDGSVEIKLADSYPIVVRAEDGGVVAMTINQSGMSIIASGDPGATNYAVTADSYGVVIDEIIDPNSDVNADLRFIANGMTGNYSITMGDIRKIDYALAVASLDLLMDIAEPDLGNTAIVSGKINDLTASATVDMPEGVDFEDPDTVFASGFGALGSYSFSSANYIFDMNDSGEQIQGSVSTGSGSLSGDMNAGALSYQADVNDVALNINVPGLPFPVDVSMANYAFGLDMPLSKSDEPRDFGLLLNFVDLGVNDEIWMMGDPGNVLPHDPITLKLDLVGKAKLFFDVMNPEEAEAMAMAEIPGELNELKLNDLTLRAAGAEVTGSGAFTFDNSDLETFDGLPRPLGEVTINVNGANALIDNLVGMGLLPEDQAMMGRMMMGMFARVVGEDQLSSTLEINADGHVLANGQRIQ